MARVVNCACGEELRGINDAHLLKQIQAHEHAAHADKARSIEQLREAVTKQARFG